MLSIRNVRTALQVLLLSRNEADVEAVGKLLRAGGETACELQRVDVAQEAENTALDNADACLLLIDEDDEAASGWLFRAGRDGPPVIVIGDNVKADSGLFAASPAVADILPRSGLSGLLLSRALRYALSTRAAEERIASLALHDTDTGLYSAGLFWELLDQALIRATRDASPLAVLMLRIDPRPDGDTASRSAIIEISNRLRETLRARDTVARFSGNVFAVIVEGLADVTSIHVVTEKLTVAAHEEVAAGGKSRTYPSSIGIAIYPQSGDTATALVRHASERLDTALGDGDFRFG